MNLNKLGYTEKLFILPFDHRTSFATKYFNLIGPGSILESQKQIIKECRQVVYEGFLKAVALAIPKSQASFLTDEEYGDSILKKAVQDGYVVCQTTEKSGQREFQFEYGDSFGEHLNNINPLFAKALLIYNPQGDKDINKRQRASIRRLANFCHLNGYKLLVEPLVHATESQMESFGGDRKKYDIELRPQLTIEMIEEFHRDEVEVDVWKIEGMYSNNDYQLVSNKAREGGRENVGIVILGRAESVEIVEHWLKEGSTVPGVIGFAIGRTIFYEPLFDLRDGKISRSQAVDKIANNYIHFYKIFCGQ